MKAIRIEEFGGPEVMKIVEIQRPAPTADGILVKVYAASVNPADYIVRQGGNDFLKPFLKLPLGLGLDAAGIVEEVGSAVTEFKKGDRVYGVSNFLDGCYTEYLAAKANQFALMPRISFNKAGSLPACARMAFNGMIDLAKVQPGQRVLVHGAAGGIGNLAVQFAKAYGAYVIGTASAHNADFLRQLGADEVIDYNTQDFEEILDDIDIVFNATPTSNGDEKLRFRSVKVLKKGGIFVCCHVASPFSEEFKELLAKKSATAAMSGFGINHYQCLTEVARLIDAGKVNAVVSKVYPWEQAADAHRDCETKHVRGKVVLEIRKEDGTL